MKTIATLFLVLITLNVSAIEITIRGKKYVSDISKKEINCGYFKLEISEDRFGGDFWKVDNSAPNFIPGFMGPSEIVSKEVILVGSGYKVPKANKIQNVVSSLKKGRTYIPSDLVCQNEKVIIAYWSGGNCVGCEAFVSFMHDNGKLINPEISSYKAYKELEESKK